MKLDDVLHIDTSEKFPIKYLNEYHKMTLYEISRWTSLMKGIDHIDQRARELKLDLAKDPSWLKPLALQKYVDEETPGMVTEIKTLIEKGDE